MLVYLDSLWSATLMPLRAYATDRGRNRILGVSNNSGPILSCLWTKVHDILRQCRGSLVLSNVLVRLSTSCFVQKIFTIKSRSRQNKCKKWSPIFWEGRPRILYGRLLARFTVNRLAKFS